eukprot:SAG31_NODE_33661_length_341_cov_0.847107_1_plen_50_part_01
MQKVILNPIASLLYPAVGLQLDSHHTFMVAYKPDQDVGLDMFAAHCSPLS